MIAVIMRTAVLYVAVTIAIRLMGKRQIGDMQPNELVVTLLISEIAAIPLQDSDQPVLNGLAAIFVLVILEIIISVLTMKSFFIRKIMSGKSVVIIKNGVVDQQAMRDVRMTVLDLVELLRGQDVFDISTVAFAVLEVNGDLSVLLKTEEQPVKNADVNIESKNEGLALPVITDGKVLSESLDSLQLTQTNIENILESRNLKIPDIFLMTLDRYGNKVIIENEDKK